MTLEELVGFDADLPLTVIVNGEVYEVKDAFENKAKGTIELEVKE